MDSSEAPGITPYDSPGRFASLRAPRTPSNTTRPFTIAVIGPSGSGKSTLIKHLTSDHTIHISTSLNPCTTRVSAHSIPNSHITLLDTPATDSYLPYLFASLRPFTANEFPDGIIYLHRITDTQVCGDHLRDLSRLQAIVPGDSLVVATSLWNDDVDGPESKEQVKREENLLVQPELFLQLMQKGAMYERFHGDLESARRIVARFKRRERGREEANSEQELERAAERQAEEILVMNGSQNESESPGPPSTNPIAVEMPTSTSDDTQASLIPVTSAGEEGMGRSNSATNPEQTIEDPPPPYTPYPTTPVLQNAQYNAYPPALIPPTPLPSSSSSLNGHVYCVSSNSWLPMARRHSAVNIAPNGQHTALPLSPPPPLPLRLSTNPMDGAQEHHSPIPSWAPTSYSAGPASTQYYSPQAPLAMAHQSFAPQCPIAPQRRACVAIKSSGTFRAAKSAVAVPTFKRTPNIHPSPLRPSLRVHPMPIAPAAGPYPQATGIYISSSAAAPHTGLGSSVTSQYHSQSTLDPPHSAYSATQMTGPLNSQAPLPSWVPRSSPPVNDSTLNPASSFPSSPLSTSNNFVGHRALPTGWEQRVDGRGRGL